MSLEALRAACADGRTSNVYYRQTQLQHLYTSLVQHASDLEDAIVSDTGFARSEARYELALTLRALQTVTALLDPRTELSREYSITRAENDVLSRKGVGVILLNPAQHTLVFSVISPLCAAIAAGNCVVLRLPQTTSAVSSLLQRILVPALDRDAFMITDASITSDQLQEATVEVIQDFQSENCHLSNQTVSTPTALTVAFVDRTADMAKAAASIIHARLAFGGRSPCAPDVVLVNEFAREKFLQAVIHALHSAQGGPLTQEDQSPATRKRRSELKSAISEMQQSMKFRLVSEAEKGAVFEATDRVSGLMLDKVRDPCLIVHSVRSLDDAIDFANSSSKTLLAAHIFAEPSAAKYLSQFVDAHASFVNTIPPELLVGPAYPLGSPVDPALRYTPSMFSRPTPSYAAPPSKAKDISSPSVMSTKSDSIDKLLADAKSGLPIRKRAKQDTTAFGFFEHALLLHLGLITTLGVGLTSAAVVWAIKRR